MISKYRYDNFLNENDMIGVTNQNPEKIIIDDVKERFNVNESDFKVEMIDVLALHKENKKIKYIYIIHFKDDCAIYSYNSDNTIDCVFDDETVKFINSTDEYVLVIFENKIYYCSLYTGWWNRDQIKKYNIVFHDLYDSNMELKFRGIWAFDKIPFVSCSFYYFRLIDKNIDVLCDENFNILLTSKFAIKYEYDKVFYDDGTDTYINFFNFSDFTLLYDGWAKVVKNKDNDLYIIEKDKKYALLWLNKEKNKRYLLMNSFFDDIKYIPEYHLKKCNLVFVSNDNKVKLFYKILDNFSFDEFDCAFDEPFDAVYKFDDRIFISKRDDEYFMFWMPNDNWQIRSGIEDIYVLNDNFKYALKFDDGYDFLSINEDSTYIEKTIDSGSNNFNHRFSNVYDVTSEYPLVKYYEDEIKDYRFYFIKISVPNSLLPYPKGKYEFYRPFLDARPTIERDGKYYFPVYKEGQWGSKQWFVLDEHNKRCTGFEKEIEDIENGEWTLE